MVDDPAPPRTDATATAGAGAELVDAAPPGPLDDADEPPVVARLMIEIRADGSRTIARGAIEDLQSGERVAIEARASSPLELSASLARALLQAPAMASLAVRSALPSAADLRAGARDRLGQIAGRLRRRLAGDDR